MDHNYNLPTWELLQKRLVWQHLDFVHHLDVLDFGSGNGVTADYFARDNRVTAIEPSGDMLSKAVNRNGYAVMQGSLDRLKELDSGSFDIILCHNVLEYAEARIDILCEFSRLLKPGGQLSILKHNLNGRVMQMAVLLNNFDHAMELLDGKQGMSQDFGAINYYGDGDLLAWCPDFKLVKTLGLRTFYDLQQNQEIQSSSEWQESMMEMERRVEDIPAFQNIAFFHHVLLAKKEADC